MKRKSTTASFRLVFGEAIQGSEEAPAGSGLRCSHPGGFTRCTPPRRSRRCRPWQSVWMLEGLRNQMAVLACRRHGLPAHQGRGVDQLPEEMRSALSSTLITSTAGDALRAVFRALIDLLDDEITYLDLDNREELRTTLHELIASIETNADQDR